MKQKILLCLLILFNAAFVPAKLPAMEGHARGKLIYTSKIDGFSLSYHLIDMRENIKKMKGEHAAHMTGTHHLMVMINGPESLNGAKAGFLVKDPDGEKHKIMAMEMGDGFGADLPMMKKGEYTIKTRIIKNTIRLNDEFIYKID